MNNTKGGAMTYRSISSVRRLTVHLQFLILLLLRILILLYFLSPFLFWIILPYLPSCEPVCDCIQHYNALYLVKGFVHESCSSCCSKQCSNTLCNLCAYITASRKIFINIAHYRLFKTKTDSSHNDNGNSNRNNNDYHEHY